jgi:hypothetical protein
VAYADKNRDLGVEYVVEMMAVVVPRVDANDRGEAGVPIRDGHAVALDTCPDGDAWEDQVVWKEWVGYMDDIGTGAGPQILEMVEWVPAKPTGVLYIEMARYSSNDTATSHKNPEKKETNRKVVLHAMVVVGIDSVIPALGEELVAVEGAGNDQALLLHSAGVILVGHIRTWDLHILPGVDRSQDNVARLPVGHCSY